MNPISATSSRFPSFQQWSPLGVFAGGIFLIDLFLPLGVAAGVLYIAVIFLSLRQQNSRLLLWTAVACSVLTIMALFISPVGGELWKVVFNRGLAVFAIWTITLMGHIQLQQAGTIQVQDQTIQDFMESIPSACFSFDRQGTILSWSSTAEQMYGYSQKEAVGASSFDLFVTPETHQETTDAIATIFRGTAIAGKIWQNRNKVGEFGWHAAKLFPVFTSPNDVSYGVSINTDIPSKKLLELELQNSNALIEAILFSSRDIIYAKNREGKYLFVNQAAREILESPFESIISRTHAEFSGTATARLFDQFSETVYAHGQPLRFEEKMTVQGHNRIFSTANSPLIDVNRNVIGLLGISRDITEEKLAEKDLLLTDRVFMNSPDHISILGRDYRYKRVNTTYQRMHKKFSHEIVGLSVAELLGDEIFKQTLKPQLEKCFQGEDIHYETWLTFPANQRRFLAVSYLPLTRENGIVQEIVIIGRDLTERKNIEEALDASERQLRTILDSMICLVGIGSDDGTIRDCNQFSLDIANLQRTDVINKRLPDTYWVNHSSDTQQQIESMLACNAKGETVREDVKIRIANETFLTADTCFVPIKDEHGVVTQIVGSAIDVTERRRAEAALQHSEEQFRDLYESAPLAYFSASFDGHITRVNGRASELLGYSRDELLGKHVLTLYASSKEGREKAERIQNKTQEGFSIYGEELEMAKKDETCIWVSLTVCLILDESGQIIERRGMVQDISAQKRIESELRASEYRYRSLIETAGSIIIGLTPDGRIVEWNREAERLYGKTRDELMNQNYFGLFIPEHNRLHIMADIKKVLAGEPTRDLQNSIVGTDGTTREILWNVDRLLDENEQPYGVICIGRDITEWNTAQAQLQKWATIFQHTQWGVAVGNASSQSLDLVNEAYARMHGYTVKELQGQPISQVFAPEFRSLLPAKVQLVHEQNFHSFESIHIRKDGTTFPALMTVSSIQDTAGVALYRVANVIDISGLKQTEQALRESEQRFRTMFEQAAVGVAQLESRTGQFVKINQRYCDITGYSTEEMLTRSWQDITYPEDLEADLTSMKRLLSGELETFSTEKRYQRKDGTIVWIHLTVSPMWTAKEKPSYHIAVVNDITERKKLERMIRRQNEELEGAVQRRTERIQELEQRRMQVEKLAALSQIAAGVAHEINNPLASISQSLVLLKRAISTEHPHFRYIAKTEDCIQRIATITKNLYQLYRPSGPTQMPIDLRMCIQTATEIMEERALKHEVQLKIPSLSEPIMTLVSRGELIQVLCNLLHNAIDASPKKGTIEMSLTTGPNALTLFLADQGEGIPPETAPHIFEPFFTTKQNRSEGGMGLGLSISHSLVKAMGGSLDFSTSLGHGSTFTITLPITQL